MSLGLLSQTIITDRPDQTESASTINKQSLQIETGLLITQKIDLDENNLYLPSSLFRIGLTDRTELRIFHQIQNINNISDMEFNNIELGVKTQLFNSKESLQIAILSHLVIANSSFKQKDNGIINKICISHEFENSLNIAWNLGYNYFYNNQSQITYSFVSGFKINNRTNTFLEPYGERNQNGEWEQNINAGVTYLIKDNIQFDYSVGSGINHKFNFMSIGFSILIS